MQYKDFIEDKDAILLFKLLDKETFIKVYRITDLEYNCIKILFEQNELENLKSLKEYTKNIENGEEISKFI